MPSGKVHDKITLASVIPVWIAGMFIFHNNLALLIIFTLSSIFSQLMFGPDLDARSNQYKRWGFFKWIWIPYRILFSHRSRFSHGLFWGPILRCAYFAVSIIVVFLTINYMIYQLFQINVIYLILPVLIKLIQNLKFAYSLNYITAALAGIFLGAAIHTFTDKIVSFFKNII